MTGAWHLFRCQAPIPRAQERTWPSPCTTHWEHVLTGETVTDLTAEDLFASIPVALLAER